MLTVHKFKLDLSKAFAVVEADGRGRVAELRVPMPGGGVRIMSIQTQGGDSAEHLVMWVMVESDLGLKYRRIAVVSTGNSVEGLIHERPTWTVQLDGGADLALVFHFFDCGTMPMVAT